MSLPIRVVSPRRSAVIFSIFILVLLALAGSSFAQSSASSAESGPRIWLQRNQTLPVQHIPVALSEGQGMPVADSSTLAGLGQAQPVSMASGDLDVDGFDDLVVGYSSCNSSAPGCGGFISIHRGNIDAFAPQSDASFQAIGHGEFPSPFLLEAQTFAVPLSPDFIALGNFTGSGNRDLAVASKGGTTVLIFANDGKGSFGNPQSVNLADGVSSLAAGDFGNSHMPVLIVGGSHSLTVYARTRQGLAPLASYPLVAPASNILFGELGDPGRNIAFLSAGKIQILRSVNMQLTAVSLPVTVRAFALGTFLWDRNNGEQIALVAPDGSVQIAVRNEFDSRVYTNDEFAAIRQANREGLPAPAFVPQPSFPSGWKVVESFPGAAALGANQTPLFFRTRVSSNGADDVMVLNAFSGQLTLISHPDSKPGAQTFQPGQVSLRPYSGTPIAAIPLRINVDGRPGVMALHAGDVAPSMLMPIPDPTFFPNRFDDPTPTSPITNACNNTSNADTSSSCSLREAVLRANATAGTDTIQLAAGTYTLTIPKKLTTTTPYNPDCSGNFGALYINDSVNIVGAGQNSTIIQAGTTSYNPGPANGVDFVVSVNEDIGSSTCPTTQATASISNLTLQNGHNLGKHGQDGDGGCMEFDTGFPAGTATLTLTNVTLQNCDTTQGNGAGLASFNSKNSTGSATITNSLIQGNQGSDSVVSGGSSGGGIFVAFPSVLSMTSTQVLNNIAGTGSGVGNGGGLRVFCNVSGTRQTVVHASTISGNTATGNGGGLWDACNMLVDQSTVISGNTAGTGNIANQKDGGGLWLLSKDPDSVTLTNVTITGNHAPNGNGGGISDGQASTGFGTMTMSFSRLAGNTVGGSGANLQNNDGTSLTVTDNWWGTNNPSSTILNVTTTATFDPFIVLSNTANPATINLGDSTTLTASFLQDNHGTALTASQISLLLGLPLTFGNPVDGTLSNAQAAVQPVNIASTTESGSTVTITTAIASGFNPGDTVTIASVGVAGYNGTFTIASTPTTTGFTYTDPTTGLADSSGGTASVGAAGTATATFTGTIGGTPAVVGHADATVDNGTATANISIVAIPPSISKSFNPTQIPLNGTTSLSFTITNANAGAALTGVAFTDTLPTGLTVASSTATVCGGTLTTTNPTGISLSGATVPASGTCQFSVTVTGATAGQFTNTTGAVTSTNAGTGNTATASLTVVAPPSIAKAFNPNSIAVNATTSLTFTITNPNTTVSLTGVGFTDTLPTGLTVASSTTTVCGGTLTTTSPTGISLSGATIAASGQCQFSVTVTGAVAGAYTNTTGAVTSNEGGTGNTASANLTVIAPPSIAKAFNPTQIAQNATTSLTFTITNPNTTVALTGVAFTDTLPTGLTVASSTTTVCGGTLTTTSPTGISLSGATVAAGAQCQFSVTVTGATAGAYTNTTGAVSSTNGGTGNTATANLSVIAPPSIAKVFNPTTIAQNTTTSLTFTITNPSPNTISLTGVGFTDTLPTGLTVASSTTTVCGGTLTTTAPTGISLTGATIAASGTCQFSVTVTGTTAGSYTNTTGAVTSNEGGTGNTATANLTVVAPPSIAKVFNPNSVALNATTSLQFTITNPNTSTSLTGVAFTDTLPTGLTLGSSTTTVCGGTLTTTAPTGISLTGATIAASGTCQFSVTVTGATAGSYTNTTGAVSSTNGGTGNTASAALTVVAPPSIAKAFNPTTIAVNATTSLTFTITNPAANTVAEAGVAFTDTLPTGLTVASGTTTVCGGTLTTTNPTGISLSGATVAVGGTCQFSVTVTGAVSGQYTNTTGAVTSTNGGTGNTATANLTVASPPSITKSFNPTSIPLNGTSTLSFSITNPNTGLALSGVAFTDSLPSGVQVAATPNVTGSCGSGTITATAGSGSISLSGGTLTASPAAGSTCTFSVNVTGTTAGVKNNSVQVTSTEGGTGNTSNATLTVTQASTATTVSSSLNPSVFGQSVTFTATVTDTSAGSTAQPTGSVQFVVDGVNFGSPVALTGATSTTSTAASPAIATLSVAGSPHSVSANYTNADGNFTNSSGSLSGGQTVNQAITATAVSSSSNPSVFGQSVTFTATVVDTSAGSTAQPTGSVQFVVDGSPFGSPVTLTGASSNSSTAASQATATLSIAGSPHSVTANYSNADGNFTNSSGSLSPGQVVTQANTTTTVNSSAGTITLGDTVTFTATVSVNSPGSGTPTGLVTFFNGSTPIGAETLNGSSQATFSTSLLAVGSDSITAIYNGDADFSASPLSSAAAETVNLRGSTTGVVLNPTSVAAGQPSTITVTTTDGGTTSPPGTADSFSPTGAPATSRTGFTSTLFADGLVLVAGGTGSDGSTVLNSAEIYSVTGGTFSSTGNLNHARTGAVAVLLPNGKVLVAGGSSSAPSIVALQTAELFDPVAGTFTPTSQNMTAARFGATATLLNTGKVLIAGGQNSSVLNSAELYDPAADTFTATGNLNTARTGHSATLLGSGKVLVAGGSSDGTAVGALNTAELFDPAGNSNAGTFTAITGANSTLSDARWQPEAALLLSSNVLVAGGQNSASGVLTSADVYNSSNNTFTVSAHQMSAPHVNGSAIALPNGMVLLPGGTTRQTVDLYDADSDQFDTTGSLLHSDIGLVATQLNNGRVLVVGINTDNTPTLVSDAELYSPSFNPLGTVGFGSSDNTDVFGTPCVLTPSSTTASTCTSTVTPERVGTSPHTITGTYPADAVHSGSSNTASLTVTATAPPTIAKAFNVSNAAQNGTVNVSFTIVNPNPASTLTGISFTDSLPAGLTVASPNNLNSNCGGTFTAVPGSSALSLTGGTVAPAGSGPALTHRRGTVRNGLPAPSTVATGNCVITVDLLVTGTGTISNTTGPISANESGPGNPSNTATFQVVLAPTANKSFGAAAVPLNGATSLTFNLANPNTGIQLSNVTLNDSLPSGLAVASPNGLTGSCVASSVIGATPGGTSISLSALTLAPAASCSFSVNVTGTSGGTKNNTTAPVTGLFDDGTGLLRTATGGTASASITVVAPPAIGKVFAPLAISPGGISTLTFTITNPAANAVAETGVAFTDPLPANVVVATPNGATGNCNSGTLTAVAGSSSISLTGGTIAAASSCVVSVNVTSSVVGSYTNTTGAVSSTNGGTGNTASATLTVGNASLSITKTHNGTFPIGSTNNKYTIVVSDGATAGPTVGTVTVVDALPAPLTATAMAGSGWTCTVATVTCTRSDSAAPGASYPPITLTVSVPSIINVNQSNVTNSATVSGGGDPNSHTASDPTHVGPAIDITMAVNTVTVNVGGTQFVNFTVNSSPGEGTITFACSGLPFGASCSFNPPSTNQLSSTVTLGITTSAGAGSAAPVGIGRTPPLYAAVVPLLGLMVAYGLKRKNKLARLRWVLGFAGLALFLALMGCGGGGSTPSTPKGTFNVTVTATSATTGDQGSATIAVTVPQ